MLETNVAPHYVRDDAVLAALLAEGPSRPVLLTGGCVLSFDPLMGDWAKADVLIGGSVIVGVGPGLLTAAGDDDMIVVQCDGCVVMPTRVDLTGGASLTPGSQADISVYRVADAAGAPETATPCRGTHLDLRFLAGRVAIWGGRSLSDTSQAPNVNALGNPADASRLGLWVDEKDFVRQALLPDGRYDEARGDRESAYQGRYWISGDRITYLDDLGFWAFGAFEGEVLHHAGYRFRRR